MSDERLRLLAELKDNMSGQLKKINKELKETKRTPGMEQAQKWFAGVNEAAKETVKAGGQVSGIMGAIGVGGLTAAASLGVLVGQLKQLGDHAFAMKRLGQETGLTIDQVKRWEYVGQIFRVPVEQMDSALKTLGDRMLDFRRRRGDLFGHMSAQAPEETTKLFNMKDADAQFHEILRFLSTIKDAANRDRWARDFFGTDELNNLLTNGMPSLEKALANAKTKVSPISPDMQKQADKLAASIVDLNTTWENFELNIGPGFLKTMTSIVEKANLLFGGATPKEKVELDKKDEDRRKAFESSQKQLKDDAAKRQRNSGAADQRLSADKWKAIEQALGKKVSYDGSGGLLHQASFQEAPAGGSRNFAASAFGLEGTIASGTKIGVLAAFREWAAEKSAGNTGAGGGGFINASYETGPGGSNPGGEGHSASPPLQKDGWARQRRPSETPDAAPEAQDSDSGRAHELPQRDAGGRGRGGDASAAEGGSGRPRGVDDYLDQKTIKGLSDPQTRKFEDVLGQRESGNRYSSMNGYGFAGRWQFGAGALQKNGYLHPGKLHGNSEMRDASWWTGKGGVHNLAEWRANKEHVQDKAMLEYTSRHYDQLVAAGIPLDKMTAHERAGFLAAAHLKGVGSRRRMDGAIGLYYGHASQDANGTSTSSYFGMMKGIDRNNEPAIATQVPSLKNEARKSQGDDRQRSADGSIEAHVHIHDGQVRGATAKSSGSVAPPRVHLRRGPTMTEPSISA